MRSERTGGWNVSAPASVQPGMKRASMSGEMESRWPKERASTVNWARVWEVRERRSVVRVETRIVGAVANTSTSWTVLFNTALALYRLLSIQLHHTSDYFKLSYSSYTQSNFSRY